MRTARILCALSLVVALHAQAPTARPQRIVSVSPIITEILFGIGAFESVVGVSNFCTFPVGVKQLPRVGGWQDINLEKIVSLRPDLVIVTDVQAPFVVENLKRLKLRHVVVPSHSLEDTFTAIDLIGRAAGREADAARVASETRGALNALRAKTKGLAKRRVLAVVDRTPGTLRDLTVATPGSFLAELVDIAGGQFVTAPTSAGYITLNKEALYSLDPDIILDIVHTPGGSMAEDQRAVWAPMNALRAVRDGKVYPIRDEFMLHTSQFVADSVRRLAETIHSEVFGRKK